MFDQARKIISIIGFWQYAISALRLDAAKEWFERVIYCHHNARVLADMEWRLGCVLCDVTRGMSKPYYTLEAMRDEISSKAVDDYNEAYAEGRKDAFDEVRDSVAAMAGCFGAAYVEGLSERLAEASQDVGTLADLVLRRLIPAHQIAIELFEEIKPACCDECDKPAEHSDPSGVRVCGECAIKVYRNGE